MRNRITSSLEKWKKFRKNIEASASYCSEETKRRCKKQINSKNRYEALQKCLLNALRCGLQVAPRPNPQQAFHTPKQLKKWQQKNSEIQWKGLQNLSSNTPRGPPPGRLTIQPTGSAKHFIEIRNEKKINKNNTLETGRSHCKTFYCVQFRGNLGVGVELRKGRNSWTTWVPVVDAKLMEVGRQAGSDLTGALFGAKRAGKRKWFDVPGSAIDERARLEQLVVVLRRD